MTDSPSDVIHDKPPVEKSVCGEGKQNILLPFPQVTAPDSESSAARLITVCRSSSHATAQGRSSEGGLAGVVGARLAAVSRGTGGCKAAFPDPALAAAAAHSHASLVLPASSVEDALLSSRLTTPPPHRSLLQHREPVEGARGGWLPVCCPEAVTAAGTREPAPLRRGTPNPLPPSPPLGPRQWPRM